MMDRVKSVPVCLAVCKREMRREGRISSRHPLHHHPAGAARIWWERQPGDLSTQMHVVWRIRGKCGVFGEWLLLRKSRCD